MGTVLTVMNMKGGVGKTTVACLLSGIAAREALAKKRPQKVLLIDYDPQYNASQMYIPHRTYFKLEEQYKTVLAVLMDSSSSIDPFSLTHIGKFPPPQVKDLVHNIYSDEGAVLDVLPSTLNLMYVALGQPGRSLPIMKERFAAFIDQAKRLYDLIVIDCHPAGSVFTQTSLNASDHVLIPVKPEGFAVRGLGLMRQFIQGRGPESAKVTAHILFNMTTQVRSEEERAIRNSDRFGPMCMRHTLRKRSHYAKAGQGKNFVWDRRVANQPAALDELIKVCAELMERMG